MKSLKSTPSKILSGKILIPGDKSISHRALMIAASAIGETRIFGLLEGADVIATANALRKLGITIFQNKKKEWHVIGRGIGGLVEPSDVLDLKNSGTGVRLLMGLAGSHNFTTTFTGDTSLTSRPMERVTNPLTQMGVQLFPNSRKHLPITLKGPPTLIPIKYKLPIPSAQVKSAILLAGLNTPGETSIIEDQPTRDHTELMLSHFGAKIKTHIQKNGGHKITLAGLPELKAQDIFIPGDISSAAFPLVAACIIPNSKITISNVGINPLRTGIIVSLREMGASIKLTNIRETGGNKIADLTAKGGPLKGAIIPSNRAPSMIDEYPILAIAAAFANGSTEMTGLKELRVKESDRIESVIKGLKLCGVNVEQTQDSLTVHGNGKPPKGDAFISSEFDHRIAMAFLILGMASLNPITIDNPDSIQTSFPNFAGIMNSLGGNIKSS